MLIDLAKSFDGSDLCYRKSFNVQNCAEQLFAFFIVWSPDRRTESFQKFSHLVTRKRIRASGSYGGNHLNRDFPGRVREHCARLVKFPLVSHILQQLNNILSARRWRVCPCAKILQNFLLQIRCDPAEAWQNSAFTAGNFPPGDWNHRIRRVWWTHSICVSYDWDFSAGTDRPS